MGSSRPSEAAQHLDTKPEKRRRGRPFADIQRLAEMLRSQSAFLPFTFDAESQRLIGRRKILKVTLDIHALMKNPHYDKAVFGLAEVDDMAPGQGLQHPLRN